MKAKQRLLSILLSLCLVLTMVPLSSLPAQAAGGLLTGKGTQEDPYQIEDADDLRAFANLVNGGGGNDAWAVLTADIDLNPGYTFYEDSTWSYSGPETDPGDPVAWATIAGNSGYYYGTFNGSGYTISGVYVPGNSERVGLFGNVARGGTVCNLGLENSYIQGTDYAGGIVANLEGTVENCTNDATVVVVTHPTNESDFIGFAGGIVGNMSSSGHVTGCRNTGSITANTLDCAAFGGIVGYSFAGTTIVENCYNIGPIFVTAAREAYAGGVIGEAQVTTLRNCYNIGPVVSTVENVNWHHGGVVGEIHSNTERLSTITNCHYLNSSAAEGVGAIDDQSGQGYYTINSQTADQMKTDEFADTLNNNQRPAAWRSDYQSTQLNGGYPVLAYQTPFEGSGTEEDPYLIATLEELMDFRDIVNTGNDDICGRLVADIDLNPDFAFSDDGSYTGPEGKQPEQWTPIGGSYAYSGIFDGDGHTISGLYINMNTTSLDDGYYGLFGYVGHGTVQDVNLTNSYLSVTSSGFYIWIGGIVGRMSSDGTISGCTSDAAVSVISTATTSNVYAGGIVGEDSFLGAADSGTVENCGNTGNISASGMNSYAGGVIGSTDMMLTVSACYNTGNVTATTASGFGSVYAGGVAGNNDCEIINCYNTGTVNADASTGRSAYAGGVAGSHGWGNRQCTISNSYSIGGVTASAGSGTVFMGGVVGRSNATVTNVYYLTGTTSIGIGNTTSDPSGVWSRTENEMKTSTTVDLLNGAQSPAPWQQDRAIDGEQVNDGYPILFWQGVFNGGVGTQEDPYLIATKEQLEAFRDLVNNGRNNGLCGKLTADIDLNPGFTFSADGSYTGSGIPEQWTPIESQNYRGSFDGDGHVIRGLYINSNDSELYSVGLFGNLSASSVIIQNLGLENSYISSNSRYAGGIIGHNAGTVQNCYSTAAVSSSSDYTSVGGVVGSNIGTVQNCFSTGPVSWTYQGQGQAYLGGVTGSNSGTVQNCFSTGTVSASAATAYAGAVVGQSSSNVQHCYYLEGSAENGVGDIVSGTVTTVESRTLEQMVGSDALTNMSLGSGWETGTELSDWTYQGTNAAADPPYALYARTGQLPRQAIFSNHQTISIITTNMVVSSDGYYLIYNADQLKTFRNIVNGTLTDEEIASGYTEDVSANGRLMADIVLNENFDQDLFALGADGTLTYDGSTEIPAFEQWTPIGSSSTRYTGTFDGNSHTVSGIYINDSPAYAPGLFSYVGSGATVQKVGVVNSFIFSYSNIIGGVVGFNYGTVQDCYNTGSVTGYDPYGTTVGGVVGDNKGIVRNCYNTGIINGMSSGHLGGVAGYNSNSGTVTNCYNIGTVTNGSYLGGVVGWNNSGSVTNCYNIGTVTNGTYLGGVVGRSSEESTTNCYYLKGIASAGIGSGSGQATPLTIAQIEGTGTDGLLAFLVSGVPADEENPWNTALSAVGTWEYGKPAVQPIFTWQTPVPNTPTYTVTIPANATVNGDAVTVSANAGALRTDQTVEVAVDAENSFELTNGGTGIVNYQLFVGDSTTAAIAGDTVLTTGNTNQAAQMSIRFALDGTPVYAGTYTGACTFAVSVKQSASE